jgi:hypothetical protein
MELAAPALPNQRSFLERIIGAALLRSEIYDEIKRDPNATFQGATVVLLGSASYLFWDAMDNPLWVLVIPLAPLGWLVTTTLYVVFAKYLIVRHTTWGMANWLLRTIAFASAPNLFYLLTPNNLLGGVLGFLVGLWSLAATVVAIRHGLNVSVGRAIWVWFGTGLVLAVMAMITSIFLIGMLMSAYG